MTGSVLIIGAAGQARALVDVIHAEGRRRIVGLIDSFQAPGTARLGYRILGGEAEVPRLLVEHGIADVVIAIGDNVQRAAMFERIQKAVPAARLVGAIHPAAVVAGDVEVGEGTVMMPGAVAVSGARIGRGCILNTNSSLDHDGILADWSSLAPGVATGGRVRIGRRSAIGLGANLIEGIRIGDDTLVGAGALVLHDLPDRVVAFGVPARIIRTRVPGEPYL
ncbi:MAG: acetyltransferase [Chromatiaceae bacterium]